MIDIRLVRAKEELRHALACLEDLVDFERHDSHSPRAQATGHLRRALLMLTGTPPDVIYGDIQGDT